MSTDVINGIYAHQPHRVNAIQWTGTNFAEVEQFLRDWVGDDCAPHMESEGFVPAVGDAPEYVVLRFKAWGAPQEAEPDDVIVCIPEEFGGAGRVMDAEEFRINFEPWKAKTGPSELAEARAEIAQVVTWSAVISEELSEIDYQKAMQAYWAADASSESKRMRASFAAVRAAAIAEMCAPKPTVSRNSDDLFTPTETVQTSEVL